MKNSKFLKIFHPTDDNNDKKSAKVLAELENIDDECDQLGIAFVKIDNAEEAKEYGIEKMPKLLYFEKGIPTVYEGNLEKEEEVLRWMELQTSSDEIEDVTDEMLDIIIAKMHHVAVLFCKFPLSQLSITNFLTNFHCRRQRLEEVPESSVGARKHRR